MLRAVSSRSALAGGAARARGPSSVAAKGLRRRRLTTSSGGGGGAGKDFAEEARDVLLFCGPSGAGKSTLARLLLEAFPDKFGFSVSHTTRAPREGEADGVDYHFTNAAAMTKEIEEGAFVEHVAIHNNMYGTSLRALEDVHREGKIVVMDVDMHGVRSIKKAASGGGVAPQLRVKCLGIIPPSLEELEKRLRGRGSESEAQLKVRLKQAVVETEFCKMDPLVDATIVNYDSWSHAYPILQRLVTQDWFKSHFPAA